MIAQLSSKIRPIVDRIKRPATGAALVLTTLFAFGGHVPAHAVEAEKDDDPGVLIVTNLGHFSIRLLPSVAPQTVDNFLTYVNSGAYDGSVFHRLVENFVLQGGGFRLVPNPQTGWFQVKHVPDNAPVVNEFNLSNVRGTVAMAKQPNIVNSATNQWFVNIGNNSANLDFQNGGFTVFGRVVGNGMAFIDQINELPIMDASNDEFAHYLHFSFNSVPWAPGNHEGSSDVTLDNFVVIQSVTVFDFAFWTLPAGRGVRPSAWFGQLDDAHFDYGMREGWVRHAEHRWLYTRGAGDPADGFWLWDDIQQDWLWTRPDLYPFLYRHNGGDGFWVYYRTGGQPVAREFYEYRDEEDPNAGVWRVVP